MKLNNATVALLACSVLLSCNKNDDNTVIVDPPPISTTALMLHGSWTETYFALDTNKNNKIDSSEIRPREELARVNYFFYSDGTGGTRLQIFSYPDYDTIPFTWAMQSDNKQVILRMEGNLPNAIYIESIAQKNMTLVSEVDSAGTKLWSFYEKD